MYESPPQRYTGSSIQGLWRNRPLETCPLGEWLNMWAVAGWYVQPNLTRLDINGLVYSFIRN